MLLTRVPQLLADAGSVPLEVILADMSEVIGLGNIPEKLLGKASHTLLCLPVGLTASPRKESSFF